MIVRSSGDGFAGTGAQPKPTFVDCLLHGDECLVPGEDGLVMTKVLLGIQQSAVQNCEVKID